MTGKNPPSRPRPPWGVPASFYGRTACAAGTGDSRAGRHRQLALCNAVAAACGWQVTAEFFDEDCRAGASWQRRPQGRPLVADLTGAAVWPDQFWSPTRGACFPVGWRPGGTAILARLASGACCSCWPGPAW
jgi:hypothetical protein